MSAQDDFFSCDVVRSFWLRGGNHGDHQVPHPAYASPVSEVLGYYGMAMSILASHCDLRQAKS